MNGVHNKIKHNDFCKNALNPSVVYSTDHSKAVVQVSVLRFVVLWFILRGDSF